MTSLVVMIAATLGAGALAEPQTPEAVVAGFDAFKAKVKACSVVLVDPVLRYTSIYGDKLTFDTSYKQTPTINGAPVNYAPKEVYESPSL